jgi:RNA polymerase-binding transcription factor DksA
MKSMEPVRRELAQRLEALRRRTGKVQANLRRRRDEDWAERAAEAENDEVLERLDEGGRSEIDEIRAALARIDAGSYGTCVRCGEAIGEARLRALPYALTCIGCAA